MAIFNFNLNFNNLSDCNYCEYAYVKNFYLALYLYNVCLNACYFKN